MRKAVIGVVLFSCAAVFVLVYQRERRIERGRQAFARYGCASCHYSGGAPKLENVARKFDGSTLAEFLSDPDSFYKKRGYRPINDGFQPMPRLKIDPEDVKAITAYLQSSAD